MKQNSYYLILILVLLFAMTTTAFARPLDLAPNHWAASYINQLLNRQVMYVYDDYNFKPEQAITRGEFAYSLARILKVESGVETGLKDINNYFARGEILALVEAGIINGYPDNTFRPHSPITRAEIIAMLGRSLGLEEDENRINISDNPFDDVSNNHWANNLISLTSTLDIIDGYPDGSFKPNNNITRAEAAKLLMSLSDLSAVKGKVVASYPSSNVIELQVGNNQEKFLLHNDALIGRNSRLVGLDEMLTADEAYLIIDRNGRGTYLKASGLINQDDVAENLSGMTNNLLKPEDLIALVSGDFDSVGNSLKDELIDNLLDGGITEEEIAVISAGEWEKLQDLSQQRMITIVSETTNIPEEVISAAMDRDWEEAKELSRVNAIQMGIQELLKSGLLRG